ncbi:MAG: HD domain-containing protein [Desulfarculus sp.]|nr:HD domain-containing protein [Desulfarculus sp.]
MPDEGIQVTDGYYFPISPLLLFPETRGDFGVYLKVKGRYVLYAHPEESFSHEHQKRLFANGVSEVYVLAAQRDQFESYMEKNLGRMLLDEQVPLRERSQMFYNVSVSLVREAFRNHLPGQGLSQHVGRLERFVSLGIQHLAQPGSLKSLASLINHHFQTYSHSVHVFVYTATVLQSMGLEEAKVEQAGLGAILHDIGKTLIPKRILNKPGRLSDEERQAIESHPLQGLGLCTQVELSQTTLHGILYHHERLDGQGYPCGLRKDQIPITVRAITAADTYDALTSSRPYSEPKTPFQALSLMRETLGGQLDPEVYRHLVLVLSGAELV